MCYRANAAYALYGVLQGEKDTGCTKRHYINSFFTKNGVADFLATLEGTQQILWETPYGNNRKLEENNGGAFEAISSACEAANQNNNQEDNNDEDAYPSNGQRFYEGYTSYTTACNGKEFVYASFDGAYCEGMWFQSIVNNLSSFNQEIQQNVECMPIYDATEGIDVTADLLGASAACSIRQYPYRCPDPHGLLQKYTHAIESATGVTTTNLYVRMTEKFWLALVYLMGIALAVGSFYVKGKAIDQAEQHDDVDGGEERIGHRSRAALVALGAVRTASDLGNKARDFAEETEEDEDYMGIKTPPRMAAIVAAASKKQDAGSVSGGSVVKADDGSVTAGSVAKTEEGSVATGSVGTGSVAAGSVAKAEEGSVAASTSVAAASDTGSTVMHYSPERPAEDEAGPVTTDEKKADALAPPPGRKYKRPFLARLSKGLFSGKKNKKAAQK